MDNHDEYDLAQLPDWVRFDPDYLDDIRDPARAARGIFNGIIISALFWGVLIGIVWLANTLIGGG